VRTIADLQLDAWRLTVLTILVLLLRRIPIVLATYKWIPDIKTFREAIFAGWFGPMGVGAIFISTLARLAIPDGEAEKDTAQVDNLKETIIPIVSFLVLSSVASRKLLSFVRGKADHQTAYLSPSSPWDDVYIVSPLLSLEHLLCATMSQLGRLTLVALSPASPSESTETMTPKKEISEWECMSMNRMLARNYPTRLLPRIVREVQR
jgi:hypothetical protein